MFNGNYKLIRLYGKDVPNGEEWEFYDLEKDPHELNNIYANPEMSGAVGEMKKALGELRTQYHVPDEPPVQQQSAKKAMPSPEDS